MDNTKSQRIAICTQCRHKGRDCLPGYQFLKQLRTAIADAGDAIPDCFEISGTTIMDGCGRTCNLAYHSSKNEAFIFGDVSEGENINSLIEFAKQYKEQEVVQNVHALQPRVANSPDLSRVPAAIISFEIAKGVLQ